MAEPKQITDKNISKPKQTIEPKQITTKNISKPKQTSNKKMTKPK